MRIPYLIIAVMLNIFISCKNSSGDSPHNYTITHYQRLGDNYHYSGDTLCYHSNVYGAMVSSEYSSDTLVSVDVFKPEGRINYSIADLEGDTLFSRTLHMPRKRSIRINENQLIDNGRIYPISELRKDSIYALQKDTLFLYTIK